MLTSTQLTTLKDYILSEPTLAAQPMNLDGDFFIANYCNQIKSPVVKAWGRAVTDQTINTAPNYSVFDSIVAGKRDSWGFFLNFPRDFSHNKVRKWIVDVWGEAIAGSNSEAILLAGLEDATVAEVLFGGTTKTTGTVSGLDRSFVGKITYIDVGEARSN